MSRSLENSALLKEIAKIYGDKKAVRGELEQIVLHHSVMVAYLADISKSLAIIADKINGEEEGSSEADGRGV